MARHKETEVTRGPPQARLAEVLPQVQNVVDREGPPKGDSSQETSLGSAHQNPHKVRPPGVSQSESKHTCSRLPGVRQMFFHVCNEKKTHARLHPKTPVHRTHPTI